jgi:hypothetical protein
MSISEEILKMLINGGGEKKELWCDKCNVFTTHISVSWATLKGNERDGTLLKIFERANDYNPASSLLNGKPYWCTKCGEERFHGGLISDLLNKGKF